MGRFFFWQQRRLFLVAMVLLNSVAWAQTARQDSLLKVLDRYSVEDGGKAALLNQLSDSYYLSNPATGLTYADRAIALSEKIADQTQLATAYRLRGVCLYLLSNYSEALAPLQTALELDKRRHNDTGIAANLGMLATIYTAQSKFTQALAYHQQALTVAERLANQQLLLTNYINMATIYSEQTNYPKALDYLNKAYAISEATHYPIGMASSLGSLGVVYFKQKQYPQALTYFQKGLIVNTEQGNKGGMARDNGNIGGAYFELGQYQQALAYHQKAIDLYREVNSKKGIAVNMQGLGSSYLKLGRYAQALTYLRQGYQLALAIGALDVQKESLEELSVLFSKQSQPDSALAYYKKSIGLRDSLNNDQQRKQITRLEMQYDFDKKETSYQQQQALVNQKVRQQQLLLALNNEQLARGRQERKLQELTYLKTQNQLQAEQLARQEQARLRTIAEQERNNQNARVIVLSQEAELAKLRSKQQRLYALLGTGLALLVLGFVLYWARMRQLRLRNRLEQQQAEQQALELTHRNQLSESELKAIRSQMNPHFIFNVLNSIESYIMESDPKTASRLVQKFASLSRLILENSTQSLVSVEREWQALQLYAELEVMRFDHQFRYTFDADTQLPLSQLLIPPMLIQPLLENAILHGLRHYGGSDGLLAVRLRQTDSQLIFTVTDNGIGLMASRRRSATRTAIKQQSFALKGIQERVGIINKRADAAVASLQLTDRSEQSEQGTVAELRLPVQVHQEIFS